MVSYGKKLIAKMMMIKERVFLAIYLKFWLVDSASPSKSNSFSIANIKRPTLFIKREEEQKGIHFFAMKQQSRHGMICKQGQVTENTIIHPKNSPKCKPFNLEKFQGPLPFFLLLILSLGGQDVEARSAKSYENRWNLLHEKNFSDKVPVEQYLSK